MATYYVRTDGSNSNAGTGPATNQAWQTVTYALANMVLTTGTNYLYIAPGVYREAPTVTITPSSTQTLVISGDPTASQFSGVTSGVVRFTNFTSDTANPGNANILTISGKTYITIENIYFEIYNTSNAHWCIVATSNPDYIIVQKCVFVAQDLGVFNALCAEISTSTTINQILFDKCVFSRFYVALNVVSTAVSSTSQNFAVTRSLFIGNDLRNISITGNGLGRTVYNCTFLYSRNGIAVLSAQASSTGVYNCLFVGVGTGLSTSAVGIVENYNRFISTVPRSNVSPSGANSVSAGVGGIDLGYGLLTGMANQQMFSTIFGSPNFNFGTTSGAPVSDMYGVTWTGTNPDAGSATYRSLSTVGSYLPTERNASTITIAPGSTSQSIELYLGATGLTASTSGLSAYYNRTRTADVQINLQARNITQNWTSGGFAEVNANTMPGVYRLDIPNEALAAGADDVTVVVRGASGTNGAVMSIKLSSGGLTTAQTASAVWDTLTSAHTTHGTYGWNVLRADQTSKQGLVTLHSSGNVNRVDADVHAIANDTAAATALKGALLHDGTGYVDSDVVRISTSTAAANELEGALLHNGTDYIDSNLIGGNSTRVFVGRFQLTQTGTTQGDIIEAFTTDTPSFELQLFDGDNNIVPVTGATLGLRILDVTSTVVETGTPTIEYGTGGIVRWTAPGTYLSIGCPAGMYRLFVDRTVSGTTTTFGPLQIKVQVQ